MVKGEEKMRSLGIVTVLSVAATAAAPNSAHPRLLTAKSSDAFIQCFAQSQETRTKPWAFMPKADGGTFSNLGAPSVTKPYFVVVTDRGHLREILLANATRGSTEQQGVDQCI
jgi:hypothetical protein